MRYTFVTAAFVVNGDRLEIECGFGRSWQVGRI